MGVTGLKTDPKISANLRRDLRWERVLSAVNNDDRRTQRTLLLDAVTERQPGTFMNQMRIGKSRKHDRRMRFDRIFRAVKDRPARKSDSIGVVPSPGP
ncbi:hypothetical protein [Rhodococcus sp. NPDC058639]|uniref:hypothetical protein n=1 Tax=Rhodococcus sp. NPDC058639 TaxID=3346570 RepID=UPI00364BA18E